MSTPAVKVIEVTEDHIQHVAQYMRQADVDEVMACSGSSPYEALSRSVRSSRYAATAVLRGEVACIFGLYVTTFASGVGSPWMLGTDAVSRYARDFAPASREVIANMQRICPSLANFVYTENKVSIRWLRWLGFTIDRAIPYGDSGQLFHKFHKGLDYV